MKNIIKSICWVLFAAWAYYLIKVFVTDSMDMELFYGVKTIFFASAVWMILTVEKRFE